MKESRTAKVDGHTIAVEGSNRVLRGLIYRLSVDGAEVAEAQNFWKVPGRRTLDARVKLGGQERHVVVAVRQRWLGTDYDLTVDGEPVSWAGSR